MDRQPHEGRRHTACRHWIEGGCARSCCVHSVIFTLSSTSLGCSCRLLIETPGANSSRICVDPLHCDVRTVTYVMTTTTTRRPSLKLNLQPLQRLQKFLRKVSGNRDGFRMLPGKFTAGGRGRWKHTCTKLVTASTTLTHNEK